MEMREIASADRDALAGIPGFLGKARDVEDLLNWTYHDQMAHSGGCADGTFTSYGVMSFDDSVLGRLASPRSGGLVPLRPVVSRLAEAVKNRLLDSLTVRDYETLVAYACRQARPARGDELVWFEPPGDGDIAPDGRPRAKYGYYGRMRWCQKRRRMVNNRHIAVCHVERRGPSVEAQERARSAYRAWHAALWRAYDSLKQAGFAVLEPAAPALPVEPWECWTPRYAKPRDLVRYERA